MIDNDDIDQSALKIEASNTTAHVVDIVADALTTKNVINISADALTTGYALDITSTSTDTGTGDSALVRIKSDGDRGHDSNKHIGLDIDFDSTAGTAARALRIRSDQTTGKVFELKADAVTTGKALEISADALTSGKALDVTCTGTALDGGTLVNINASGNTGSDENALLKITNDHASSTGTSPLSIKQDSTGPILDAEFGSVGSGFQLKIKEEAVNVTTSGTTTTISNFFPANAMPIAMHIRVTTNISSGHHITQIGNSTDASLITASQGNGQLDEAGDAKTFAIGSQDAANFGGVNGITAAQNLVITHAGTPTAGAIRVVLWYWQLAVPSS